jgi:hypothetical protein
MSKQRVATRALLLALWCAAVLGTPARSQAPVVENIDVDMARATMLRRLNRKAEALAVMNRAVSLAPHRDDVRRFRDLLEQEVSGSEASVGGEYTGWDDGREPLRESQVMLRRNTVRGRRCRLRCSRAFRRNSRGRWDTAV